METGEKMKRIFERLILSVSVNVGVKEIDMDIIMIDMVQTGLYSTTHDRFQLHH